MQLQLSGIQKGVLSIVSAAFVNNPHRWSWGLSFNNFLSAIVEYPPEPILTNRHDSKGTI
jgi:hypothetical protein